MKRNGNANSNRAYNPRNTKPSVPLDVDEIDAALERFIRQKYDQQIFSGRAIQPARRNNTGSTRSSDDQPPPLPPKPGKRLGFGLRSVSSALTLSKPASSSPPKSPEVTTKYRFPPSPIRVNKQSRVFGVSVGDGEENLESKLATLRDMGFPDDKNNASVLKSFGGNLERSIESLVRLAEGSTPGSRSRTQTKNIAVSQPLPSIRQQPGLAGYAQVSANNSASANQLNYDSRSNYQGNIQPQNQVPRDFSSMNPFEPPKIPAFQPVQPQSQPQSATFHVEQDFEGMQVSQPLFPNATGGYPSQHQQLQEVRVQQSMTPPVPQLTHQVFQSNHYIQSSQTQYNSLNPFLQTQQLHSNPSTQQLNPTHQQSLGTSQYSNTYSSNVPSSPTNELFTNGHSLQQPEGYSQQQQKYGQVSLPLQGLISANPYAIQNQNQTISPQQYQSLNHIPPQPLHPQRTGHFDKFSILALYNYPQLAPVPPLNTSIINDNNSTNSASSVNGSSPTLSEKTVSKPAQRSVTMPVQLLSGSRNPFNTSKNANTPAVGSPLASATSLTSQESVNIGGLQNGRHSPDAFASLSARSVR